MATTAPAPTTNTREYDSPKRADTRKVYKYPPFWQTFEEEERNLEYMLRTEPQFPSRLPAPEKDAHKLQLIPTTPFKKPEFSFFI